MFLECEAQESHLEFSVMIQENEAVGEDPPNASTRLSQATNWD
jgi:hypothetical protein